MSEYRVKLDIYSGPLDLLLYLIRRNELDVHDIAIAKITEQYLEYVELIKEIDIDLAGEFLVMAATLMEIKSALVLPRPETAEEGEEEDLSDPRLELVRQLLEYKKFKDLSSQLDESAQQQALRFPRSAADIQRVRDDARQDQELDLESVQIWDLFDAFNDLMKATLAGRRGHEVIQDDTPIDLYEADILDRAQRQQPLTFQQVFEGRGSRLELVGLFLALLELIRQKLVNIEQEEAFSPIYIFPQTDLPADQAVAHAISADAAQLPSEVNRDQRHKRAAGVVEHDDEATETEDGAAEEISETPESEAGPPEVDAADVTEPERSANA